MLFETHIFNHGPDSGVAHLHTFPRGHVNPEDRCPHNHETVPGSKPFMSGSCRKVGNAQDKLGLKTIKAINHDLVYIQGVGYVPESYDGMVAVKTAQHHYKTTGNYDGLEGPKAETQHQIDELKMFNGLSDQSARSLLNNLN